MSAIVAAVESFPEVSVCGSPYQRGWQHGAAVPERIAHSAGLYRLQLARQNICTGRLRTLAQGMQPAIKRFDPDYLEEMQGIADGAGVPLEDVILINCRSEMLFGYGRSSHGQSSHGELSAMRQDRDDGCTNLVVLPENADCGRLMHAHSWDWREKCLDAGIVLRIRRGGAAQEPDLLILTEAGSLARHGFNSAGLSLTGNSLSSDRDYRQLADVPLVLVLRKMLEAPSMHAAMKLLWRTRRLCSINLMLAQAGISGDGQHLGDAVDLECAPDEIFWLTPQHGLLVHASHWLCPVAHSKLRASGLAVNPDSLYRQRSVETAMLQTINRGPGKIDWATVKKALADDFPGIGGVLRKPDAAVATTLIDAASRTMWIACKPHQPGAFVEYRL
ncbi:acyl-coenzyme A:6-aminopenicillanic acid acyl-transferase family protein [Collimonas fungivorans]|uniref:Acyl-coenzyme A:6-aminopenicillanic acid acyl-transferase family protein n=1 Tax=Collimonas fungivorans TaxID=158899 RepID=A0A127PCX0_9BURK|nr:C45 family peptidase [Collimonas fungivorans]AMO95679.1 acyl-coenzyme A:6-aminopenicillanic acid acyl-transferase family protein [Collimonas fungivorans]